MDLAKQVLVALCEECVRGWEGTFPARKEREVEASTEQKALKHQWTSSRYL